MRIRNTSLKKFIKLIQLIHDTAAQFRKHFWGMWQIRIRQNDADPDSNLQKSIVTDKHDKILWPVKIRRIWHRTETSWERSFKNFGDSPGFESSFLLVSEAVMEERGYVEVSSGLNDHLSPHWERSAVVLRNGNSPAWDLLIYEINFFVPNLTFIVIYSLSILVRLKIFQNWIGLIQKTKLHRC